MDVRQFDSQDASAAGRTFGKHIARGFYLVVYPDAKNGRLVTYLYHNTAENVARIARLIKTQKAVVFENGRRLDDSQFTGE